MKRPPKSSASTRPNGWTFQPGYPEWDACFAHAQSTAYALFLPASDELPHPSFVQSRRPDHGHSLRGDGSDYPHLWSGQTALDAWYLNTILLPGRLPLAKGVLENFLNVQEDNGEIDWKPGLAGQRSRQLAQPLLAALAWQIYEVSQDDDWLETCFIPLLKFFTAWFTAEHDADEDGMPEWKHALQTGFPEAPIYNRWQQGGQAVDITILECPSLAGFLFNECQSLIKIAERLKKTETIPWLESKINRPKPYHFQHVERAQQDLPLPRLCHREQQQRPRAAHDQRPRAV